MSRSSPDDRFLLADLASIQSLAMALVSDRGRAEEVAQEAILQRLGSDSCDVRSRRAWLSGIVGHVAATLGRRDARRTQREERAARRDEVPSTAEILEREDSRRVVIEAVLGLREPTRSTMVLRYLEDLPPREVARRLGVPVETVRTRARRGIAELRERLETRFGGCRAWVTLLVPHVPRSFNGLATRASELSLTLLPGAAVMSAKKVAVACVCILALATWSVRQAVTTGAPAQSGAHSAAGPGPDLQVPQQPVAGTADPQRREIEALPGERAALATSPATATQGATVRLLLTRATSGRPAPGVRVLWRVGGVSWLRPRNHEGATDAAGVLELEGLEPGRFEFLLENLQHDSIDLVAGSIHELEVALVEGLSVTGTVTETGGAPVADAEIVLEASGSHIHVDFPVARTDLQGRYELRDVLTADDPRLSVQAAGFGSTIRRYIHGPVPGEIVVDFVLGEPGAALHGVVLDETGGPVEGAIVLVGGVEGDSRVVTEDGGGAVAADPLGRITDDEGKFHVAGVGAGDVEIRVRATGFATKTETVLVTRGIDSEVRVRLDRASRLEGVVVGADGSPVEGAEVIGNGRFRFVGSRGTSDLDGRYRIEELPIGEYTVELDHRGYLPVRKTVVGVPGRTAVLNIALSRGAALVGRVESVGTPVAGARVRVTGKRPGEDELLGGDAVSTDAGGRFRIEGLVEDAVYAATVHDPVTRGQIARRPGLRPGPREVVIEVAEENVSEPSVYLIGRVVDASGEPVPWATYSVGGTGVIGTIHDFDAIDGSFRAGPYTPGEFTLFVQARDMAALRLSSPPIEANGTWDLGVVTLSPGGKVELRFARDADAPAAAPEINMWRGYQSIGVVVNGDTAISQPAPPGEYELTVAGGDGLSIAESRHKVVVREGETTVLELPLRRGFHRPLRAVFAAGAAVGNKLKIDSFDAAGNYVHTRWSLLTEGAPHFESELTLAEGEYRLVAETTGGYHAELEIEFSPRLEGNLMVIELEQP